MSFFVQSSILRANFIDMQRETLQILSSNKVQIERVLQLSTKGIWGATFCVCLGFAIAVSTYAPGEKAISKQSEGLQVSSSYPLEKIAQGPLSLSSYKRKSAIPDMSKELLILAKNVRPDRAAKDASLRLALKGSQEEYIAKNGEQVFLSCDASIGNGSTAYHFSDRKTPLWIRPTILDQKEVLVEVGIFMPSKETETFVEEKTQFIVQHQILTSNGQSGSRPFVAALEEAKLWGQDAFLLQYGGKEYQAWNSKQVLEIPSENRSLFYLVQVGDLFEWRDGEWASATLDLSSGALPLAAVKTMTQRFIELEVWDESGFYSTLIRLDVQPTMRTGYKNEALPQGARLRTSSQVTCCLGKKRLIVKEGDWILKTGRGWKNLKKAQDIEDYVCRKIRGELFVFDGMVHEHGKLLMKGHWIDETRTQVVPFSVPVSGERNGKSKRASSLKKDLR